MFGSKNVLSLSCQKNLESHLHLPFAPGPINCENHWHCRLCSQGGMESQPSSEEDGPSGPDRENPGLNSAYVTAKQRSCLGASRAEKSGAGSFWAMRETRVDHSEKRRKASQSLGIQRVP